MLHFIYFLVLSVSLFTISESVSVYVESGDRKYFTSFSLPVIDGKQNEDKEMDVLELRNREPNDEELIVQMISNFPKLKYINISSFDMEEIPKLINLPAVEYLFAEKNRFTKIKANKFSQLPLKTIDLPLNQIEEIEENSFGVDLTELNLDCNLLTELNPNWFKNQGGLKTFTIQRNKLTYLEENLLKNFINLTHLDLTCNEIVTIGNGAFTGPKHFNSLRLHRNHISELQPEIFSTNNNSIDTFSIGLNRLNFLSQKFLDKINVKRFLLFGNPWQCPCLKKIESWLSDINANTTIFDNDRIRWAKNNPVCIFALSFSNICIEAVDNELYNSYSSNLVIDKKVYC